MSDALCHLSPGPLEVGPFLNWGFKYSQLAWKLANPSKGITLRMGTYILGLLRGTSIQGTCMKSWAYYVVTSVQAPVLMIANEWLLCGALAVL